MVDASEKSLSWSVPPCLRNIRKPEHTEKFYGVVMAAIRRFRWMMAPLGIYLKSSGASSHTLYAINLAPLHPLLPLSKHTRLFALHRYKLHQIGFPYDEKCIMCNTGNWLYAPLVEKKGKNTPLGRVASMSRHSR